MAEIVWGAGNVPLEVIWTFGISIPAGIVWSSRCWILNGHARKCHMQASSSRFWTIHLAFCRKSLGTQIYEQWYRKFVGWAKRHNLEINPKVSRATHEMCWNGDKTPFRCQMATQSHLVLTDSDWHYSRVSTIEVGYYYTMNTDKIRPLGFRRDGTMDKAKFLKKGPIRERMVPLISLSWLMNKARCPM